jgi:hypothetical protein
MRYTDFDTEFPRRCLGLLGKRPFAEDGNACTKLLSIGGTIVTATADRQFANGTQVHIATGGTERQLAGVREFLRQKLRTALPTLREQIRREYPGTPPDHWVWDPLSFHLSDKIAGSETLFREIIAEGKSALLPNKDGNIMTIADAIREFRNALAHGNVWLLAGADFPPGDPRSAARGAIVGFVFATTNPKYEEPTPTGKPRYATIHDRFVVKGLMLSPFDLRAIIEGWAVLLRDSKLSRGTGGQLVTEVAVD